MAELSPVLSNEKNHLRLGTRGSLLARAQSQLIADQLMRLHSGLHVELVTITSTGDRVQDRPLHEIGGKGLFTKELELALLAGDIDFAVHSYKDVPVTMPLVDQSGLIVAAVPVREDPRDVAVLRDPVKGALPHHVKVGTSSLRRQCQILETAPDAQILPIRGNIDTRIRKLRAGEYDVVILAMAGLKRAGLFDPTFMKPLNLLPAAGQGALALQCRRSDDATRSLLAALNDGFTQQAVDAERAIVRALDGDCHSPIAALATEHVGMFLLRVAVGGRDGTPPMIRTTTSSPLIDPNQAVDAAAKALLDQGAHRLLHGDPA